MATSASGTEGWPGGTGTREAGGAAGEPGGGAPAPLEVRVLAEAGEAERWRDPWEDLVARSSNRQVTASPLWLLPWWRVFGGRGGRALRLGLLLDGERLVGLAPLLCRTRRHRGMVPVRRLELLGTGEDEADEIASEYVGVVAERGREASVAEALAAAIADGRLGACDELVLTGLDGEAPLSGLLGPALAGRGFRVETEEVGRAPYVALPATWEAYLAGLSGSSRYMVKRSLRDFEAWAAGQSRIERATDLASLEAGQRVLMRLHEARWRAAGRAGAFASQAFRAFHEAVMPALLARGALELAWLCVRDEPVAVSYSLVWNDRVQYYQGGRTTDVPKGVRPGIVLHANAIRQAIEARRVEYDFLAGDAQYKTQLAGATRPLLRIRAARPGIREAAIRWLERGAEIARAARRARTGNAETPDAG